VEKVKCFRYWRVGHFKWECPNIEVEKQRRRKEKAVYVARPQKAQQERRPVYPLWEKAYVMTWPKCLSHYFFYSFYFSHLSRL